MNKKNDIYISFIKRFLDLTIAFVAFVVFLPVLLVVAILVRLKLGSPVIFVQVRPGKDGVPFRMYKFRTMTNMRDKDGRLYSDEVRLTKFGMLLRSTSLDELPELWNIIKGEMSLVGPRPLLMEYLPLYSDRQATRHEVRPGLTGLAQVSGRNSITWEERLELDAQYVETMSFNLDCKIILRTVRKTLKREGISSQSSATMEHFKGENNNFEDNPKRR